jgi:hypothetical protein
MNMSEKELTGDDWYNKRQNEIYTEIQEEKKNITRHIEPKEHAAIVRKELKKQFPDIKFSVRTDVFAGGSAVDVYHKSENDSFYHQRKQEIDDFIDKFDGYRSDLMDGNYNVGFEYEGERLLGASFCTYHGKFY